jgi:NADPH:quinone reductase-like Zn-dependent oxidoreductase
MTSADHRNAVSPIPSTMNALRSHRRGGPETLVYERAPTPSIGPDEVLVEVHAAGITFHELTWDLSWQHADGSDRTPIIPAHEMSGIVVRRGDNVTSRSVGDRVFGMSHFDQDGAAAEYVAATASELALAPTTATHIEAAALPIAGLTARQAIIDHAMVLAGEHVVIHGGAGGVGAHAVQIAHVSGARVTATAHTRDVDVVAALGAHRVIDIDKERFDDVLSNVDVVIDTIGGHVLERSFAILRPGGRLITLSAPPSQADAIAAGVMATFFVVHPDAVALGELARLVDDDRLHPVISNTFRLADGRRAFESANRPRLPGKTVLVIHL